MPEAARAAGAPARPQTLLAFDYGTRRVGVAVGNTLLDTAEPLATIDAAGDARLAAIARLVAEWQPAELVVGVPRHPDGAEHDNTQRYSTTEALAAGQRGAATDAAAAAILLRQHLDERARAAA